MARPLRFEYEGAIYHVTARGNEKRKIFFTSGDYRKFKEYLNSAKQKYGIVIHGYALMSNHYHLIVETPGGNLSKAMHHINSSYTTFVNIKRKRAGHLFQGRYKAILVDKDSYLLELSRYIHLNPVRAGIVNRPDDYAYSSYRAFASGGGDRLVDQSTIFNMLDINFSEARKRYCEFVYNGIGEDINNPFQGVFGGFILGGEKFIKETLKQLKDECLQKEDTSHRKQLIAAFKLEDIIQKVANLLNIPIGDIKENRVPQARKVAIYLAKKYTGANNKEVGDYFSGLSYSGVAKTNERFIKKIEVDKTIREWVAEIEEKLSNVKG